MSLWGTVPELTGPLSALVGLTMHGELSESVWPGGEPFALCLTHDVDRVAKQAYHYIYYGIGGLSRLRRQLASYRQRLRIGDPYWNFESLMAVESEFGVRSTFLFLNEPGKGFSPKFWGRYSVSAPEVKRVIRELDVHGWEVGLHGSFFSFQEPLLLGREKQILEEVLGGPVRSTRQHYLNLDRPLTWRIQEDLGLKVDSTLGYSDRPWDASNGVLPFYPEGSAILELPITVMDTVDLKTPAIRNDVEQTIESMATAGGLVVLDWHQSAFNEEEFPERVSFYRDVLGQALDRGAWVATMGMVHDHWERRSRDATVRRQ